MIASFHDVDGGGGGRTSLAAKAKGTVPTSGRSPRTAVGPGVPAAVLTGYAPGETSQLGFTYLVQDQELGEQAFAVGSELPFREDPSLWARLDLRPSK